MLMMASILMRMGAPVGLFHMHDSARVKLGPDLRFQWKFKVVPSRTQDGPYVCCMSSLLQRLYSSPGLYCRVRRMESIWRGK